MSSKFPCLTFKNAYHMEERVYRFNVTQVVVGWSVTIPAQVIFLRVTFLVHNEYIVVRSLSHIIHLNLYFKYIFKMKKKMHYGYISTRALHLS